jgi:hypothetical protein
MKMKSRSRDWENGYLTLESYMHIPEEDIMRAITKETTSKPNKQVHGWYIPKFKNKIKK